MLNENNNIEEESKEPYWEQFSKGSLKTGKEFNPKFVAMKIAAVYMLLGIIWILLSDKLLELIIQNKEHMILVSSIKGGIYVIATGGLLFGLVYSPLRRIKKDSHKILESYIELSDTYDRLEAAHEELTASEEELRQQFDTLSDNQKLLAESEERYRLISEAANDAIWDEWENNIYYSERWFEITGYTREEIEEIRDLRILIHPEDRQKSDESLNEYLEKKASHYLNEYRFQKKDGAYIWIQTRGKALFDENGNIYRMAGSHRDITELKEYQEEMESMAYQDVLTGLPNRYALYEDMSNLFLTFPDKGASLLFIDVDNFKFINDSLGHVFGDELLKILSKRLEKLLGKSSNLYRLGGDEFIILMKDIDSVEDAESFAAYIYQNFKSPVQLRDSVLHINISIGIAKYPEHGKDVNELMRCADIAMYNAKMLGRNRHVVYAKSMNDTLTERMLIEEQLRTALLNDEFDVYYQPQLDIKENKITGLEALLRWNNPKLGFISPLKFIPIAEDTHLIMSLGEWVLNKACAFIKRLHGKGHSEIIISVNISMLQLLQEDFVEKVLRILRLHNISPESLELEITESILMESYEAIEGKLEHLYSHGIKIALDDFGKGYSSLSYLKQLPISTLKIDKSFIDDINGEEGTKSLTGHIVTMGRSLGLNVVAEGVETTEQVTYLIDHGCHKLQGYLFSKPVVEQEAEKLIENNVKL